MCPTRFIVWLICGSAASGVFLARSADQAGAPAATTNAAARAPFPPLPKPQVTYFRELLALSPTDLDRALASISEPARGRLQAKLQEYAVLAPDEREARLRAIELRWYLVPLMRTVPTSRVAQLALVPEEYRTMVEERYPKTNSGEPMDDPLFSAAPVHFRIPKGKRAERSDAAPACETRTAIGFVARPSARPTPADVRPLPAVLRIVAEGKGKNPQRASRRRARRNG